MAAPTHFNSRQDSMPGGTDFTQMSEDQVYLAEHLRKRMITDPEGVVCYILNHTTEEEQREALGVYQRNASR